MGLLYSRNLCQKEVSSSADYGKNALKKNFKYQLEKKRWKVNIKLSQFTPRKEEEGLITPKVRILIIEIIVEGTYLK